MAFQRGFPDKLNVPMNKIQNKDMGDFNINGRKGRYDIDNMAVSNKVDVGLIPQTRMKEISGVSPDICCD